MVLIQAVSSDSKELAAEQELPAEDSADQADNKEFYLLLQPFDSAVDAELPVAFFLQAAMLLLVAAGQAQHSADCL